MGDDEIISEIKKDYIYKLAEQNKRIDGRAFSEYRPIRIERGIVSTAEGSARVKLGGTDVIVGIKMEIGAPFPDTPERGVLTTNAELIPMASPSFEAGPPSVDAIEVARVVDRGIRESQAINLDKLVITKGEKVWVTFIDIHVLDYDGNLFDASTLGALSAILSTKVPASKFGIGEDFPLPVQHIPVSCTFVKLGNAVMLDPNLDEETIAKTRLTVTTNEMGEICAMQKGLTGSFTIDEVKAIIQSAKTAGEEVRKKILG